METFDRKEVIVPNSKVISPVLTNSTRKNSISRLILDISIRYQDDRSLAEDIIKQILQANEQVLSDPPYSVFLWELGDFKLTFRVQLFINLQTTVPNVMMLNLCY